MSVFVLIDSTCCRHCDAPQVIGKRNEKPTTFTCYEWKISSSTHFFIGRARLCMHSPQLSPGLTAHYKSAIPHTAVSVWTIVKCCHSQPTHMHQTPIQSHCVSLPHLTSLAHSSTNVQCSSWNHHRYTEWFAVLMFSKHSFSSPLTTHIHTHTNNSDANQIHPLTISILLALLLPSLPELVQSCRFQPDRRFLPDWFQALGGQP